ncbi:MAG: MFS transporter, partial [Planctomycetes bacterium]|nr:MFS transporter [Planctomycetota bacterium]
APAAAPGAPRRAELGIVFLVLLIDLIGFSIVFPLLADMLEYYGAHDQGLLAWAMAGVDGIFPHAAPGQRAALFGGLIGSLYATLQFFAAPYWGRLSDRIGRRPVLLLSIGGNAAAYLLWVFSGNFTVLLVSRMLAGIMTGSVSAANAAVADLTTPETRARGMGFIGMAFGLGFIIGPAIGGLGYAYLPRLDQVPALAALGANPFSSCALIAFALGAFNFVWCLRRFRETLPPERRHAGGEAGQRTSNPLRLFSPAVFGAVVARVNATFCIYTLLFSGMEATMVFLAAQACGFTPKDNGMLFVMMGVISALMQGFLFRRLAPRIGQKPLAVAGLAASIPGFALLALVTWFPHTAVLVAGAAVLAIGTGLSFPALSTMVSLGADPLRQGWVLGSFRSAGALGRAFGPLLAAVVYFRFSPAAPYVVGAVGLLVPLALMVGTRVGRNAQVR